MSEEIKRCETCEHCIKGHGHYWHYKCRVVERKELSPVSTKFDEIGPEACATARIHREECGPEGKLWQRKRSFVSKVLG